MSTFQITEDIYGIDLELFDTGVLAAYLIDAPEPTLIDTGTAAGFETLLAGVRECGIEPSNIENAVLTHVHLDHSGATGHLLDTVTDIDVYIHEMTAQHLVSPDKLVDSTRTAMGEYFEPMGEPKPVPESNIVEVSNAGTTLDIGDISLELRYGPGYSPDHFAVWSPEHRVLFAAECLGSYLHRADQWVPPATLPNFDIETLETTIDELRELDPEHIAVPHAGVLPHNSADVFDIAQRELERFNRRICELYETTDSVEATETAVSEELIDISPPYDPIVEAFYTRLITRGFLKSNDLL